MIKIISDSTCDLSKELIEKYNIAILPLHIHLDEEEYQDGVTISPDEIYAWADANNTTPKTSAASMAEMIDLFQPYIDNGDEIICFSISSSMSANYNAMRLAVDEMEAEDKIRIIDSANLSTGIGLQVIEAAIMAEEGKSLDEIVAQIEEYKPRVSASFVVDTLTYLHRGGRCSSVAALAGGVLKLHPRIGVEGGKMDAGKKYRGKIDSVIANKYKNWRSLRTSQKPLIILIGGASGVGTSSMAFELANRLRLKNLISTDMIREVMRKMLSKDLSPVIHKSSFDAHESIRTTSISIDNVIEGFVSHVDVVNVGIEAIIERSVKEGISIIIEGVHIVPGFIRKDLLEKDNVLMFTLTLDDEEIHKNRLYSRCSDGWAHRSLQKYLDNFDAIRKIQMYIKDQGNKEGIPVIENIDRITTIDFIINSIAETYGGLNNVRKDKS